MRFVLLCYLFFITYWIFPQGKECSPVLLVDGYKNGDTIPLSSRNKLDNLTVLFPCTKATSKKIISYLFAISAGSSAQTFSGYGSKLTSKIKASISGAGTGDKICIDKVFVKNSDGSYTELKGITLLIGAKGSIPMDTSETQSSLSCDPLILIGKHKNGSSITKNELNLIDKISITNTCNTGKKYHGCSVDIYYKISSFEVGADVDGKEMSLACKGPDFPQEVKEVFRNIKNETKLFIRKIIAKYPDGSIVNIPDVSVHVMPNSPSITGPGKSISEQIDLFAQSDQKTVMILEKIYYINNEYKIAPESAVKLDSIFNCLSKHKNLKLQILSYTDAQADDKYNLDLSIKRAGEVRKYFEYKGIQKNRIAEEGKGESKILNRCLNGVSCSDTEHEVNRRTEFIFHK